MLTVGETQEINKRIQKHAETFQKMQENPELYPEYTQGEVDQWNMVILTLKKCLGLSQEQVNKMAAIDARDIFGTILRLSDKIESS